MVEIQWIYGLHNGDGNIFYVGRTNDLNRRLAEHIASAETPRTRKEKRIAMEISFGNDIFVKPLASGTAKSLRGREDLFITNLEGQGVILMNDRGGDDSREEVVAFVPVPWSVAMFTTAVWKPDVLRCKVGEVYARVNGVAFFRTGKRKLRFEHAHYGAQDVSAGYVPTMEQRYAKACAMLTTGTAENNKLEAQAAQP